MCAVNHTLLRENRVLVATNDHDEEFAPSGDRVGREG